MEISKSTPYVRYRENISSTLHKGTIHIESEYLDRERKTTIESIEGQTWQNMVNGENKEEEILPRLGLKIEGNEDVLDTVEQHMPIDTIVGDVEPVANDDGTYTYEISTMEGSYAKTLDGENNFSLTSDGLVGDMYIKYNAQGEEVNGSIVMSNGQSSYTIENSNIGEINNVTLKGQTLVNLMSKNEGFSASLDGTNPSSWAYKYFKLNQNLKPNTNYTLIFNANMSQQHEIALGGKPGNAFTSKFVPNIVNGVNKILIMTYPNIADKEMDKLFIQANNSKSVEIALINFILLEGDYTNVDLPYFEGIQSVENPTVITSNSPVQFGKGGRL